MLAHRVPIYSLNARPPALRRAAVHFPQLFRCQRTENFLPGLLTALYYTYRMVGVPGFEPETSSLSETRSNQLSYTPYRCRDDWWS